MEEYKPPDRTDIMPAAKAPDGDMVRISLNSGGEITVSTREFYALVALMDSYQDEAEAIKLIAGEYGQGKVEISHEGNILKLDLSNINVGRNPEQLREFQHLEILSLKNTSFLINPSLGEILHSLHQLRWLEILNGQVFATREGVSQYINYLLALPKELSEAPPPTQEPPPETDRDDPDTPRRSGRILPIFLAVNLALIGAGLAYLISRSGDNGTAERNTAEVADTAPPPPSRAKAPQPARVVLPAPQPTPPEIIEAPETIKGNLTLIVFALNNPSAMITLEGALEGDSLSITRGNQFNSRDDETIAMVTYTITLRRGSNIYVQNGETEQAFFDLFSEDEATSTFTFEGDKISYPVRIFSFGNAELRLHRPR